MTRDEVIAGLRALLCSKGVTDSEFDRALAEDRIDLLTIDTLLRPGQPLAGSGDELAASSGVPPEHAERLWRALGFAEATDVSFTEQDLAALRTLRGLSAVEGSSPETAVQMTRVLGSSMSRVADALVSAVDWRAALGKSANPTAGGDWALPGDDGLELAATIAFTAEFVLPSFEDLMLYAWRRHILAAVRRRASLRHLGGGQSGVVSRLTVGFADMVGFTALSSQLPADDLARVVDRFEELAHTTVVNGGGRVVKMIGDEVMFVASDPAVAVQIGLALVDAYADDDLLSDVRVGVAEGEVLTREGDFFGSVVNRASRIVSIADAGTVLVDEQVHDAITSGDHEVGGLEWQALKPRDLKDIGRVSLWSVAREGRLAVPEERRGGMRWRRLSGRDAGPGGGGAGATLAGLRSRGERAIESLVAPFSIPHAETTPASSAATERHDSPDSPAPPA